MKKVIFLMLIVTLAVADIGKVTVVKGEATINRNLDTLAALNNMSLFKQDIVETEDGRLQMLFEDKSVISLGKDTRFIIKEYLYEPERHHAKASFKVEKGFVKAISGAIGKILPEYFTIETSFTKVTPHGTIWSVEVDEEQEIYEVIEGRISLAFHNASDKNIDLLPGERVKLIISANKIEKIIKSQISRTVKNSTHQNSLEKNIATFKEEQKINKGRTFKTGENAIDTLTPVDDGNNVGVEEPDTGMPTPIDDGNNGHGNDPGGVDPSNPGNIQ